MFISGVFHQGSRGRSMYLHLSFKIRYDLFHMSKLIAGTINRHYPGHKTSSDYQSKFSCSILSGSLIAQNNCSLTSHLLLYLSMLSPQSMCQKSLFIDTSPYE